MRLLITRPQEDARSLKMRLEGMGHQTLSAPMMAVERVQARLDLKGVQALLFTSANGVRAFAGASARRDIPAWTVGPATAAAARAAGFAAVLESGGDADRLAADVIARLHPAGGRLLHAAGSIVTGRLGSMLIDAGFRYERAVLYDAKATAVLPDEVQAALRQGGIDGVLLYSPRTARLFLDLVRQAGLADTLARVDAYCLSRAVAGALKGTKWRSVRVAPKPDQSALLGTIGD